MIARRLRSERGWALVTAMMVVGLMSVAGLAMYSVVDTQTRQTTGDRNRESSFYLSDAALNETAFLLSRHWPSQAAPAPGTCTAATVNDYCPSGAGAWQSQFNTPEYRGGTWQVQINDDTDGTATACCGSPRPPPTTTAPGASWPRCRCSASTSRSTSPTT